MEEKIQNDIVEGISTIIPEIYKDGLQPATKVVGTGLVKTGKILVDTVNTALLPLEGLVWGINEIKENIIKTVTEKLNKKNTKEIKTPDPRIAGTTLEGLKYTAQEKDLREMYINLLTNSMDAASSDIVHPAFPEIIKQISKDEAKILEFLAFHPSIPKIDVKENIKDGKGGFRMRLVNYSAIFQLLSLEKKENYNVYLNNLERLKLIEIPVDLFFTDEKIYLHLEEAYRVKKIKESLDESKNIFEISKGIIKLSEFGILFCNCCVDKTENRAFIRIVD